MTVAELLNSLLRGNVAPGAYDTDEGITLTYHGERRFELNYWGEIEKGLLPGNAHIGQPLAELLP
jgi:hypothetical protein